MKTNPTIASRTDQRGVTLIVALIFLAILMLLGVTVAQTSSLEERMAGNTRDRDLALQSAEAALKVAETYLKSQPSVSLNDALFSGSTAGLVLFNATNENHAAYWNAYDWAAASQDASTALKEIAEQPKYVIEKLPDGATTKRFRVTARGIGSSANTAVILQAGYERNI